MPTDPSEKAALIQSNFKQAHQNIDRREMTTGHLLDMKKTYKIFDLADAKYQKCEFVELADAAEVLREIVPPFLPNLKVPEDDSHYICFEARFTRSRA